MLLSLCKIISLLFFSTFSQASNPEILLARLTHHQSTNSPLYDPNLSLEELAEISLKSSISRGLYLTTNSTRWFQLDDIEADLTPASVWDGFLLPKQYNASRFSYCFGKISNRSYPHSTLVIGSNNIVHGSVFTTPLVIEDDRYYVNMEILMVGERLFELDPLIFTRNTSEDSDGGVILDTGLSLSFMPFDVVIDIETVYTRLIESLGLTPNTSITYRNKVTRFCYNGVVTRDLTNGFPTMKLVFRGGAVMEMEADSVFQQTHNGTFCLAILPSEHVLGVTTTILGTLMQQNFNVVYDIEWNNVSFTKGDCQTVEDYYDVNDEL
ncbi:eukaryotic aspartyl protease family protein [Striga asiatica]|uniref:Eukaryotic aspartyl protease family protein n=1 Tax=Striga asiatica TaxID=4170 RepID=A0A5A7R546_STRAF|nr:eukaryotic aspartyl protease family protein [Striga asiatica]